MFALAANLPNEHCVLVLYRPLILNKQKILTAQASSAYKHSLKEVLAAPGIAVQIKVKAVSCAGIVQPAIGLLIHCLETRGQMLFW